MEACLTTEAVAPRPPRIVLARWQGAVLVCKKCSKKLDGGFGRKGRTRLAKALRKEIGVKKGQAASVGIVEVDCLGLCPAGGVTVVDSARPDAWLVVERGTDLAMLAAQLLPDADDQSR